MPVVGTLSERAVKAVKSRQALQRHEGIIVTGYQ